MGVLAIIKTIKNGNCTVYIDDEYAKTLTPEEKRKKLERIGDIYYEAWKMGKLKDHN